MLPSAPKLYEYANESRFRNLVGSALSANALALASLRTSRDTVTPSGAIDFTIAGDGTVTMVITPIANALSVGYIVDAAGYDTDSSGQTLGSLATPLSVDLGVLTPGTIRYVTAWFYSAAAGAGDASPIASARKFDYDADVGPLSVSTAKLAAGAATIAKGGVGFTTYAAGDMLYASALNTLAKRAIGSSGQFLRESGGFPTWHTLVAANITDPAALTRVDDTNITLTLGGAPSTALLGAVSLTLGWTGTLSVARGGTSFSTYAAGDLIYASAINTLAKLAVGANGTFLKLAAGLPTWAGITPSDIGGAGSITRVDDTNVTLTLGGTPSGSVLNSVSFTLGWTGTLAASRGGTGHNGYVAGDLLYATGVSALGRLSIGASGDVLSVSGGAIAWTSSSGLPYVLKAGDTMTGDLIMSGVNTDIVLSATAKLRLDGSVSGDTYIYEASANNVRVVAGGSTMWIMDAGFGVGVPATTKLYLDGLGDTYLWESAANVVTLTAGGASRWVFNGGSGFMNSLGDITIRSGDHYFFDGSTSGDTYMYEVAANQINCVAGGSLSWYARASVIGVNATAKISLSPDDDVYFTESSNHVAEIYVAGGMSMQWVSTSYVYTPRDFSIAATKKFYLDGVVDTYITEVSSNVIRFVTGGTQSVRFDAGGAASYGGFRLMNTSDTNYGGFYRYLTVLGSGADNTPTLFAETGLGMYFSVNGSATVVLTITSAGGLIGTNFAAFGSDSATRIVHTTSSGFPTNSNNPYIWAADGTGAYSAGTLVLQPRSTATVPIVFATDGTTPTESFRIYSTGVGIPAARKFWFDGAALTGDTYMYERSANVLGTVIGGNTVVQMTGTGQTTDGSTKVTLLQYVLPSGVEAAVLEVVFIGYGGGNSFAAVGHAVVRTGGAISPLVTVYTHTSSGTPAAFYAELGTDIDIKVTGNAATTINWTATVRVLEES